MLNLAGLARAPSYDWEVMLERKHSLSAYQNARRKIAYVTAPNADDARKEARKKNPEFVASSARRVMPGR